MEMNFKDKNFIVIATVTVTVILLSLAAWPQYRIYSLRANGVALLAQAENEKKVLIEQAKAQKEAASLLAAAEVERAKGVAEANKIIGVSLKENEAYLRYLWIQGLQDGSSEVIYVATEANLPILEAGKRVVGRKRGEE